MNLTAIKMFANIYMFNKSTHNIPKQVVISTFLRIYFNTK